MESFILLDTGAWSLVPPLLALALALITKEVYSSLIIGIVSGLLIYQFSLAGVGVEQTIDGLCLLPSIFIEQISANAGLILFLALLGALTMLITKAGGSLAYAKWAVEHIKNPRIASVATALLGVIIFVDDYFNCLTVGSVMRPVTDRFKICREKLAWIIDSTAAPICIIVPVSSWAVAVGGYLGEDGFNTFVASIPYNFYALLTIIFVFALCACGRDWGPMKRAQQAFETRFTIPRKGIKHASEESLAPSSRSVREDLDETLGENVRLQDTAGEALEAYDQLNIARNGRVFDLIVPILVLIIFSILGMMYVGGFFSGIDFAEHASRFHQLGCEVVELRSASDLDGSLDALVLPGGESTTQTALLEEFSMLDPIKQMIVDGMPVLATCAGVVLLAREIEQLSADAQAKFLPGVFATLPVRVQRNAYGRQLASFHAEAPFRLQGYCAASIERGDKTSRAECCRASGEERYQASSKDDTADKDVQIPLTFIRAPQITSVAEEVDVLVALDGQPVAVRFGNQLGITFHPELDADNTLYQFFLTLVAKHKRD